MSQSKIAIIIGSTRANRFSERPAQWLFEQAKADGRARFELVDLRDHPLPFFDEPMPPVMQAPQGAEAVRWANKLAEYDGYVFTIAEYNHGLPGVLKNAVDYGSLQFGRKPAAFVGYGGTGAARSIEQARLLMAAVGAAPMRFTVNVGMAEFMGMLTQGKDFSDYPYLAQSAQTLLDELIWWADTLKAGRTSAGQLEAMRS
ncbi:MAG: NADPH-dependent FMN reductase [Sphingomonadales bacterium]